MRANTADHPVVVVLDAPPEGDRGALVELVEQQLPELAAGTRARVADLVRQVSGTGRRDDRAGRRRGRGSRHPGVARPPGGRRPPARRAGAVRRSSCSASRCTGRWDRSLEAYATLCATHVAAALSRRRPARRGAPPTPGPRRARRGQERVLHQPQPRAAHPAHPHLRPGAGGPRRRGRPRAARAPRARRAQHQTPRAARRRHARLRPHRGGWLDAARRAASTWPGSPRARRELPAGGRACRARVRPRLRRRHRGTPRPRHGRAGRAQPAVQRGEVHPRGVGRARRAAGRRRRRDRGERHRGRHPPG